MATTRIMPLHVGKGRAESRAISDIIDYVTNPKKTDNGRLITGYACDSRTADAEFLLAKRQYIAATGRVRGADDVIAYHVRQSFRPGEIAPEEANRLGVEFAKRFTKGNHAFVVCTHIDKSHIHNHIIWSSVSLEYDRKFRNFWGSTKAVRQLSDTICIENGLSIVENPKPHGKSYNKWLGDQAKPSHREQLRVMIDQMLEQKPADFDALLKLQLICDMEWTGEAIGNIVKNALDHTQAGGIVRITWDSTPAMFRIFISDNGNGIVPEDIYHIFKRFYRSKHSLDTQGIGLGLPLAKSIIEGQGGMILVQSEVGNGTTFTLSFLTEL